MSRFFKAFSFVVFLSLALGAQAQTPVKNRMDLDDLTIKGELHNDDRLLIISRQKNEMKNFVKFRTNYREEILQQLPKTQKKRNY
ncbi:MAG: hypothetical protein KF681_04365 [Bdellovibrionaceae bacterium]|nr:hypothetical protein [Pseudobdellovibrionaceae bacterium]